MHDAELQTLSLEELIELRDRVSRTLKARFEQNLALLFTDVVDSTGYIARHGDVAGRSLLRRHHDLLERALANTSGRVVDTAGDGAFCVAATTREGVEILSRFQQLLLESNASVSRDDRLEVRMAIHTGPVLCGGEHVSGEAVHVTARIMSTATAGQIRLSEQAQRELPAHLRARCQRLASQRVPGIAQPLPLFLLDWRDEDRFVTSVEIIEEGRVEFIPCQRRVSLGRLAEHEGKPANDVVLSHPDTAMAQRISRWHLELEMTTDGYVMRTHSHAPTTLDNARLRANDAVLLRPGAVARVGDVLTLVFHNKRFDEPATSITTMQDS